MFADERAYVANGGSASLSVIDTETNTVTTTVPVGGTPNALAVTPSGDAVYAAISVASGDTIFSAVAVVGTASNRLEGTIPLGGTGAQALAFSRSGSSVYVATGGTNSISVVDIATQTVRTVIPIDAPATGVAVGADGDLVYVTSFSSVFVIDSNAGTVAATISMPGSYVAPAIAVSPNGRFAYVTGAILAFNDFLGRVSGIDTDTNRVVSQIDRPAAPVALAVTPDGSDVYVAELGYLGSCGDVFALNVQTGAIVTILVGCRPSGLASSADGASVYVTNEGSDTLSVVDTASNQVSATITVGVGPKAVAVASLPAASPTSGSTPTTQATPTPPSPCSECACTGDRNGDGQVTIDEIVSAVNNALSGCRP